MQTYIYAGQSYGSMLMYQYETSVTSQPYSLNLQPKYYTTKKATSINVSTLNNTGLTLWTKDIAVNNGRPYITDFYW